MPLVHDGNYSVVVRMALGVESALVIVDVNTSLLNGLVGWWKFDDQWDACTLDSSGNDLNANNQRKSSLGEWENRRGIKF